MSKKIILTQEQEEEIVRLREKEHYTVSQIAEAVGLGKTTVIRKLMAIMGEDGYKRTSSKLVYDRYFFHQIDTKEKAYWLGFVTADGYVNEQRKFLQIHLQWSDKEHLEKLLKAIQAEKRIQVKQELHSITGNKIATICLNGKEIVEGLVKQGVRQGKSTRENPPENLPEEFYPDYIRGLWDGDGCINKRKIDISISFKMCAWLQDVLIKKCNITKTNICFHCNTYRLMITKNRLNVLEYLYYPCLSKDIVLDRKYKNAKILLLENRKLISRSELKTA